MQFKNYQERAANISQKDILTVNHLGHGAYGSVDRVRVTIHKKCITLAQKRILNPQNSPELLKKSLQVFELLKKSKIPTVDTFRISGESHILMTDLSKNHSVTVHTGNSHGEINIKPLNVNDLLDSLFEIAKKAAKVELILPQDTLFLLIDKNNLGTIKIVDLDFITIISPYFNNREKIDFNRLLELNINFLFSGIMDIFKRNFSEEISQELFTLCNKKVSGSKKGHLYQKKTDS